MLLGGRRAEYDDLGAEFGRELDGQVAEATDAYDADAVAWLENVDEAVVDGSAGALQRSGDGAGQVVWDGVQVGFGADVVAGEGAGAEGGFAIDVAGVAVDVAAGEAVGAFAAGL